MKANIYTSNRLENLADSLKENLFSTSSNPFEKRCVILPNQELKNYLALRFAKDPELNIFAGVQFLTLTQAFFEILKGKKIPSSIELALLIEKQLYALIAEQAEEDAPLLKYLDAPSVVQDKRVVQIADQLSFFFLRCTTYSPEAYKEWGSWQKKIWLRIFSEESAWTSALDSCKQIDFPIFLFGFSSLPKLYFEFFKKLNCSFFILSPCQLYWGDLRFEDFRVLANLGKLGSQFCQNLENESYLEENYCEERGSFLKDLQADFLNLEEGFFPQDESIRLQAAATRYQEVELLYKNLIRLLKTPSIAPRDIRILSPNINDYVPYIHMVFWQKGIPYSISGIDSFKQNPFFQGLFQLLSLEELRFEKHAVLKLFGYPQFAFAKEESDKIRHWIEDSPILWGFDLEQRARYLGRTPLEESEAGTWLGGLDQLLDQLVTAKEGAEPIEFTEAELFGKCARMLSSIKCDLQFLAENEKRPFAYWAKEIKRLAEKYFTIPEEDLGIFKALEHLSSSIELDHSFANFKRILQQLFEEKKSHFHTSEVNAVHFTSLNSGSAVPAEAIFLLGMEEGAFPRLDNPPSFFPKVAGMPSRADEDRMLFLEQLLAARRSLNLSYLKSDNLPSAVIQELKLNVEVDVSKPCQEKPHSYLLPEFHIASPLKSPNKEEDLIIDIKHLNALARNPIQFYFNRAQQIYLEKENEKHEFNLSNLDKSIIKKKSLYRPLQTLMADAYTFLPQGAFRKLASAKISKDVEQLHDALKEQNVRSDELFEIELKVGCMEPIERLRKKVLPPLHVMMSDGRKALIIGKIADISPRGLLHQGEDELANIVKVWPSYLVCRALNAADNLLFTDSGPRAFVLENPLQELEKYLHYYELCQTNVSPLMPDWAEALLKGVPEDMEKAIKKSFNSLHYIDVYLKWIKDRDPLPSAGVLFERWSGYLRGLYELV